MKRFIYGLLFTITVFVVFLVARTPALFALDFLPKNSPVTLEGVSGSIWNGHAHTARLNGAPLGELHWNVNPLSLLLARLSIDFTLDGKGFNAEGRSIVSLNRDITLSNISAHANVKNIPLPPEMMLVTPSGKANANFTEIQIVDNKLHSAKGTILWNPASITSPAEYDLGKISLEVSGDDGKIKGQLSSKDGPLDAKGTLNLSPQGMLSTHIKITPNASTPPEIKDMLPIAARPAADGSITIKQQLRLY